DMSFQILFFFVMIYHPSALEVQLDLKLPTGKERPVIGGPALPGPPVDVTVVVRTQRDGMNHGGISQLVVQAPNGVEKTAQSLKELSDELKKLHSRLGDVREIKIQADGSLKWAFVVQVMDVCHAAGIGGIGF